ncbi:hypothetical protein QCA50_019428 [Cerrena zonata]|uniref:peptidylprolyl isomerase n=1 Tax=Cerrena zonata TaxID=2478898 RepID=A0AAW0FCC2_9APHY
MSASGLEVTICSLTPGQQEQYSTQILLPAQGEYIITLHGVNPISLIGFKSEVSLVQTKPNENSNAVDPTEAPRKRPRTEDSENSRHLDQVDSTQLHIKPQQMPTRVKKFADPLHISSSRMVTPSNAQQTLPVPILNKDGDRTSKPVATSDAGAPIPAPQVIIVDHSPGEGDGAAQGDVLEIFYRLLVGNLEIDSRKQEPAFRLCLGQGSMLKAFESSLVGLKLDGERQITIPPELGYGKEGNGNIPPDATLCYQVKLLRLNPSRANSKSTD